MSSMIGDDRQVRIKVMSMQKIVNRKKPRTLANRIEALEAEVEELKRGVSTSGVSGANRDLQAWAGLFKDDPGFDEAVKLGRAWRRRQPKC